MAQRGWVALLAGLLLQGVQAAEPLRVLTEHSPPGEYLAATVASPAPPPKWSASCCSGPGESAEIELLPWMRAYQIASSATAPRCPIRDIAYPRAGGAVQVGRPDQAYSLGTLRSCGKGQAIG